jgi:hypothetical protein
MTTFDNTPDWAAAHSLPKPRTTRDAKGAYIPQGIGSPQNPSMNSLMAIKKYEGIAAWEAAVRETWRRSYADFLTLCDGPGVQRSIHGRARPGAQVSSRYGGASVESDAATLGCFMRGLHGADNGRSDHARALSGRPR